MNVYELIDDLYHAHSYLRAGDDKEWPYMPVRQMLDAYFALAPTLKDWAVYPNAMWYVIEISGDALWFEDEPRHDGWRWTNADWFNDIGYEHGRKVDLPDGVDARRCKWQRPEVAA